MLLLGDEVGGNIYMTGDGHTEGAKVICEKGCIAKWEKQKKQNISQLLRLQTYLVNLFVTF